jgi:DNA repair protein RadC
VAPRPVGTQQSARDLILSGATESVTNAGLIAVMIGEEQHTAGESIVGFCPEPEALWRLCAEDLVSIPGVGPAKAARLLAALEMSRRAGVCKTASRPYVSTPEDVVSLCWPQLRGADKEHFWALALNIKNRLLKVIEVSVGSLNASIVHPRELFKDAVRVSAASVVVVHNHPSGDPSPSGADIQLTRRLVKAGDVLGIDVLDHVIIGDDGDHASMRELGLM